MILNTSESETQMNIVAANLRQKVEVVIINKDGLICMCPPSNKRRYWTIPGGGIDEGETHVDAAIRECLEEVGIMVKNVRSLNFSKVFMNITRATQEGYDGGESHFYVADFSHYDTSLFDSAGDGRNITWQTLGQARRAFGTDIFSETRLEAVYMAVAATR